MDLHKNKCKSCGQENSMGTESRGVRKGYILGCVFSMESRRESSENC